MGQSVSMSVSLSVNVSVCPREQPEACFMEPRDVHSQGVQEIGEAGGRAENV